MIAKFEVDPIKLRDIGLTLFVTMTPIPAAGSPVATPIRVGAILDTGSAASGVNGPTAARLVDARRTERGTYTPTLGRRVEPALRSWDPRGGAWPLPRLRPDVRALARLLMEGPCRRVSFAAPKARQRPNRQETLDQASRDQMKPLRQGKVP